MHKFTRPRSSGAHELTVTAPFYNHVPMLDFTSHRVGWLVLACAYCICKLSCAVRVRASHGQAAANNILQKRAAPQITPVGTSQDGRPGASIEGHRYAWGTAAVCAVARVPAAVAVVA